MSRRILQSVHTRIFVGVLSILLVSVFSGNPASGESAAPVVFSVKTSDPVIFITIDDGFVMNAEARDLILSERIPITLFLKGNIWKQPRYREFFSPLVTAGATVGNHTEIHSDLAKGSASHATKDICTGRDSAEAASGQIVNWLRPPGGSYNHATQIAAASCGQTRLVLWDVTVNGEKIATYGGPIKAGDIILFHWRKDLHISLKKVLSEAKRLGLTPASLADYLQ